jgi:hypothetical protein
LLRGKSKTGLSSFRCSSHPWCNKRHPAQVAHVCCGSILLQKSKIEQRKNLAKVDFETSPQLHWSSALIRGSVIDFGFIDMAPHIAVRKTHRGSKKFRPRPPKDFCNKIGH